MSFSTQVKAELCRTPLHKKCCAQAEAYGVLLYCSLSTPAEVRITTESPEFAARLPQLFFKAFQVRFDRLPGEGAGKRIFSITQRDKLSALWAVFGRDPAEELAHHINFAVLEEDHCRFAFLRGAFLAGGSVTDPEKQYHLELVTAHYNVSRETYSLLLDMGFSPKSASRSGNHIIYFKSSAAIEDFLTTIGAPVSAMDIMSAKIEKGMTNSVNRLVNCDTANVAKTVDAAQSQIEAINILKQTGKFKNLPEKLKYTAEMRLKNPELSLSELAEAFDPPVTKSGLNHRFRKIMELAGK